MRKFKIGDKVRIKQEFIDSIKRICECVENENEIGTIIRIKTYDPNSYCPYTIATVIFKSTGNREQEINISNLELVSNFDWEAFKKGKVIVHCDTEKKAKAFLEECDKHNIKWNDITVAANHTSWKVYRSRTCYNYHNARLAYASRSCYESEDFKIIECPFAESTEYPEIHITTDGKTTTAVKTLNGKKIAKGVAKCHPDDKFNFEEGAKLAFDRLSNPFKPYLELNSLLAKKLNYGIIGTETAQEAPFGEKLYVGDVVEIYNVKEKRNCGCNFVISNCDYPNGAVMGVACSNFKNGMSGHDDEFQIRKVKSYKDLKNGEKHDR